MQPITVEQMIEVDRLMMGEAGIILLQMMENAGRSLKELAAEMLGGSAAGRKIAVLVGKGNNGGGGLVAARHLVNAGTDVTTYLSAEPGSLGETPDHQLAALAAMEVAGSSAAANVQSLASDLAGVDLIIDALIGYSLHGAPREPIATMIRSANAAGAPILALDIPSGVDGTTGEVYSPAISATATMTLAWPKAGLLTPQDQDSIGQLYLADISVPAWVYRAVGIDPADSFHSGPIRRLT